MLFQSIRMAWSSICSNKMRSFLTMLGIIIGVMSLVVLVSIANGATSDISASISSMGTDLLTVSVTDDQDIALDVLGVTNTENALDMELRVNGIAYQVVGFLKASTSTRSNRSSYEAYIAYTSLKRISESVGDISSFVVSAESDEVLDRAEENLNAWMLGRFDNDEEAFTITNQSEVAETMESVMNTMAIMLGGIAAISLLVGGIGIMNIMPVSVTERTREIGIRKAIGAGEGSIMLQFLIEALMISLLGCLIGIGVSWVALRVVLMVTEITYAMNRQAVIVAVIFSTMIGLIFGLYPAAKAARKKPIDALRYTG